YAPDSIRLATSYKLDSEHLRSLGRLAEARTAAEQALTICGKAVGTDHPAYGEALIRVGEVLLTEGRAREAVPVFERALALLERGYGRSSPALEPALLGLADALVAGGDPGGALAAADRAVALAAKAPPGELEAAELRRAEAHGAVADVRAV